MKKERLILIFTIALSAMNMQSVSAQSWNLTGNNNAGSSSKLGTTNVIPLRFFTSNAERLRIDAAGNVGIGTLAPVNKLTVQLSGSVPASSWLSGGSSPAFVAFGENMATGFNLATAANASGYRPVLNTRRSRGTLASPAVVLSGDYLASIVASGYDGSAFQNPATIDFYVDGTPSSGNVPGRISFVTGTNATNRSERLKVGSSGNFNFNNDQLFLQQASGNVGIGTSSPGSRLAVVAGYDGDGIFVIGSSSGPKDAAFGLLDDLGHSGSLGLASANNAFMSGVESGDIILSNAGGKIHLGTGAASAFPVLTVAGANVGIGTRNPGFLLDVAGRMRIKTGNGTAGTFFMNQANTVDAAFVGMLNDGYLGLYGSGVGWGVVMNTVTGNVGIGNTAPLSKLHLNVNGFDAYQGLGITNSNTGGKTLTINQGTAGKLNFTNPGVVDLMTMDFTSQNVGIGTTAPGYKLDVCGTIRSRELRVETGWCDYVFEKDYKLRSIADLEKFINDNKHLPGVAPASEVEKEGLKVGEMNKAMMEKIEELTLYVIQLSKENKKLQEEMNSLSHDHLPKTK